MFSAFLRIILTSESSVDPARNAYYLKRLPIDGYFHRLEGSYFQRVGHVTFKFDELFKALEFQMMFDLDLCRYRKPDDHQLLLYEGLILALTGNAHGEYQRIDVSNEPGQRVNYVDGQGLSRWAMELSIPRSL